MRSWRLTPPSPLVRRLMLLALVAGALALWSCYPGEITSVEELDIVATIRNQDSDFATMLTYHMPDSVVAIDTRDGQADGDTGLDPQLQELMLALVDSNLADLGYTRLDTTRVDEANAVVTVSVIISNGYVMGSTWPWWGYWGWNPWYPGWGWGPGWGPGYPPVTTVGTFDIGTVLIDMVDVRLTNAAPDDSTLVVGWYAGINGLASSNSNSSRVTRGMNQAFTQSPYLATGSQAGGPER